jgi:glycosyltransferase involved in cell wall biosynthesis
MNIGIVTTWFERGAAYVSRQYRDLLKEEFTVHIYARAGERYAIGDPAWDDGKVTWGKRSPLPIPTAIEKEDFCHWIISNRIETVLFNEQWWWIPLLWCRELGVKTCAYVDYYTEETIPLFSAYEILLCNTRRHFEAFAWHPGARYIPWGTDVELFKPSTNDPVTAGAVTFFHSAGMNPRRKGTDFVIEAFTKLRSSKRLVIHTQVNLLESFPNLRGVVGSLLDNGELHIIEATVPAPGKYHLGDVYVYPSRLDGIGLSIVEALSCGLPVIVSDNAPMNEFAHETSGRKVSIRRLYSRADGYYWPQCEVAVESLIEQMQWYLDRRDQLSIYKRQARNYALKNLDWKNNKSIVMDIFKSIKDANKFEFKHVIDYEQKRGESNFSLMLYAKHPEWYKLYESYSRLKTYFFSRKVW